MKTPLVSIIVPVYNPTTALLDRCVRSILDQNFRDFELLLVDDGSTDGSQDLCDVLASEDERIKVFHKQNGGVASARNVGLDNAIGKYIGWIDSDDYIDADMYEKMVETAESGEVDVVSIGYCRHKNGDVKKVLPLYGSNGKIDLLIRYAESRFHSLVITLSRRDLWHDNGLRFIDGCDFSEDLNATVKLYALSRHTRVLDIVPYHYVDNSLSMCNTLEPKHIRQRHINVMDLYNFLITIPEYDQIKEAYSKIVLNGKHYLLKQNIREYVETAPDMNKYLWLSDQINLIRKVVINALFIAYPVWKWFIKKNETES